MKKLVIITTALSLLNPFPVFALEEMDTEILEEKVESLESDSLEENLYCTFQFVDSLGGLLCNQLINLGNLKSSLKQNGFMDNPHFPFYPKDYVMALSSSTLEDYIFLEDLPILQESDFTNDPNKINKTIKLCRRQEEDNTLTSITESVFTEFEGSYEDDDGSHITYVEVFSSPQKLNLNIQNDQFSINEEIISSLLKNQNSFYVVNSSSLQVLPILSKGTNVQTLGYLVKMNLKKGSYDEIKDRIVKVDFSLDQDESRILRFPLSVLCPESPTNSQYTINSDTASRMSKYINDEGGWEENGLPNEYTFSFDNLSPQTVDLYKDSIQVTGEIKTLISSQSCIKLEIKIGDGEYEDNNLFPQLFEICEENSLLISKDKLESFIKKRLPISSIDSNFQIIDFSEPQIWNTESNVSNRYIIKVKGNELSSDEKNNSKVSIRFVEPNLRVNIFEVEQPWKDFFEGEPTDTLTAANLNSTIKEKLAKRGFELATQDFKINLYGGFWPEIDVKSTNGYSLEDVDILEYGHDESGNPNLELEFKGCFLNEGEDYTLTAKNNQYTFVGKGIFEGTQKVFTYPNATYFLELRDYSNPEPVLSIPLKKGAVTVSEYLNKIPNDYIYNNYPVDIYSHSFEDNLGGVPNSKVAYISVVSKPKNIDWKVLGTDVQNGTVKVRIPYKEGESDSLLGTISLSTLADTEVDFNAISKDTINSKLLGYEVIDTPNLVLSDSNFDVIGYQERYYSQGSSNLELRYLGLEYKLKSPLIVQKKETQDIDLSGKKAEVSLGDLKVEIPLANLKDENSNSSAQFKLTAENLKEALVQTINQLAQKVLSSNAGSAQAMLPGYDISVESLNKSLTSTSIDLTEELTSSQDSLSQPKIVINVKPEHYICLRFNKNPRSSEVALLNEENEMVLMDEEIREDVSQEEKILIVKVSEVADEKGDITLESLKNFADKKGIEFEESAFSPIALSQAQDISMINPETGYIDIEVPVTEVPSLGQDNVVVTRPPKKKKPKPQEPTTPEEPTTPSSVSSKGKKKMFRLFNTVTGEHFYTSSEAEKNGLLAQGAWSDEGQGWVAPESSNYPVYRVFNPNSGEHHYTPSENEYKTLVSLGWNDEGIGWFSADDMDNKITLYRLYNPTAPEHAKHHYTVSSEERDHLLSTGEWNDEGVAWYGMPQE